MLQQPKYLQMLHVIETLLILQVSPPNNKLCIQKSNGAEGSEGVLLNVKQPFNYSPHLQISLESVLSADLSHHLSIHYPHCLSCLGVWCLRGLIAQDGVQPGWGANQTKIPSKHSRTYTTGNLPTPISVHWGSLDCGKKPEDPEDTHPEHPLT